MSKEVADHFVEALLSGRDKLAHKVPECRIIPPSMTKVLPVT